jgi:TolA-binding protein
MISETFETLIKLTESNNQYLNEIEKSDRKNIDQSLIKLNDNNKKIRDNVILVKTLTEKQIKKLNSKIKTLELRIKILELENKEFKADNNKIHDQNKILIDDFNRKKFIQGLSDIYREYNK